MALGESDTQEFKRTTGQRSEGAKAICAMLNHRGGRVIFGVEPATRALLGQVVSQETLDDVAVAIREIRPSISPRIDRVVVAGTQEALVVTVDRGSDGPYSIRGVPYKRLGATNRELSQPEADALVVERVHGAKTWESELAAGWTVADLDGGEVVRTLEEAIRRGRATDPQTRDVENVVRGFGLMREGQLLRAAVVLFGRERRLLPDYPQCLVRVARFRGTSKTEFTDSKQFLGNAFELLSHAERFLLDHVPIAGRIVPGQFARIDQPLYPLDALREALANAFCHRDYAVVGGSVGIAMYDDRLEITSSGPLHFGLRPEDLYKPHDSLRWNPLIAGVFFRRGIVETWGRGTIKIAELMQQAGLPRPEFEEIAGALVVRFRPGQYVAPQRVGQDLSAVQREILTVLSATPWGFPVRTIQARLAAHPPLDNVKRDLQVLRVLGMVETWGHAKGARWQLRRRGPADNPR